MNEKLKQALREGLEDLITSPGFEDSPSDILFMFDVHTQYPKGRAFIDRACFVMQGLRMLPLEIESVLTQLGLR